MARFTSVTDDDLARARSDPAFRQQLLTENLGALIDELSRRKPGARNASGATPGQLREGAALAVRLADIITRLDHAAPAAGRPGPAPPEAAPPAPRRASDS